MVQLNYIKFRTLEFLWRLPWQSIVLLNAPIYMLISGLFSTFFFTPTAGLEPDLSRIGFGVVT